MKVFFSNHYLKYLSKLIKFFIGTIGLVNAGNTCYVNSVIQVLYMTSEFGNEMCNCQLENTGKYDIAFWLKNLFRTMQVYSN